jgi:putative zinc finger/helix-turn-helix YgiT family protein
MPDLENCSTCGGKVTEVLENRELELAGRSVTVLDHFIRCATCGEQFHPPGWLDETLRKASAIVRDHEGLLRPEQIRKIRENYQLSQREFEQLLGVGAKTVVRWERGTVFQSKATDSLLRLVGADRRNAERLAKLHGVRLPREEVIFLAGWNSMQELTQHSVNAGFSHIEPYFSQLVRSFYGRSAASQAYRRSPTVVNNAFWSVGQSFLNHACFRLNLLSGSSEPARLFLEAVTFDD